jgi:DNA-binding transcriptional MerR regulator
VAADRTADRTVARADDLRAEYTVGGVARRLGVAPSTLRTWHRRYGLGPASHADGRHRRYSEPDVAALLRMQDLVCRGVPAAVAARLAAHPDADGLGGEKAGRSASGGRVLALPGRDDESRGLARAAMALDTAALDRLLGAAIARHGLVSAWSDIVAPVLRAVGERWANTGECVEVEHVLSDRILVTLRGLPGWDRGETALGPPQPVLLACPDDEWHGLPAYVLAAALAERGVPSRVLGASTPGDAIAAAARRIGPPAIFVWSQRIETARAELWAPLPRTRPAPRLVAGGPGWVPDALPVGVQFVAGLEDALALLVPAARAR